MSPEVWVPLALFGAMALMGLAALVVWRVAFRGFYPNCTCWMCGRRRR